MNATHSPLTPAMINALTIAQRDGAVCAGRSEHKGRVESASASAILALIRRGLLTQFMTSEGCVGGRIV